MWRELYRLIYKYLSGLGLCHEDAQDLTQETILAVHIYLDGIQPGKLKAWGFCHHEAAVKGITIREHE